MAEEIKKENTVVTPEVKATPAVSVTPAVKITGFGRPSGDRRGAPTTGGRPPFRRGGSSQGGPRRDARPKSEYDNKIINIRRVTRVVSGGKRMSFSVVMVVGNRKGSVGVGSGKASDTALAIEKAMRDARKNAIQLNMTKSMSIPYQVEAKFSSARIVIKPLRDGSIVAGSSARHVIELSGLKGVNAKIHSPSKNKTNIAMATIKALESLKGVNIRANKSAQGGSVKA